MKALAIAATGMAAQQTNLEVISNNIANMNTTGYKASRAEFTDLLYQVDRAAGVSTQAGESPIPEGIQQGLGVKTAAVRKLHAQGALVETSNTFDLAIDGKGWFQVTGPDGETLYTRAGAFNVNNEGQLVTLDGYEVQPGITVPEDAIRVSINQSGEIFAILDGDQAPQDLGQMSLATFVNDAGLLALGGNLFRETEASGAATEGVPGDPGFGVVHQGYLESANVDPVKEITELISAQRAYEMNSKVIQAADDMAGTVSKGIR
ncbi:MULTISPECIES: flagellar basal-body rod protein FlgG [Pseudovibrio]|uniref:flagellar basal-body rod protein FlgG n=1 Tax=Stappiaceae TaxID=2821832 RepID=UPI002365B7F3|nr:MULTISPECIES: flagellar basal-body rod protein FlgG [Pseudovibrio]MDD7909017.1 flagellar basal-body rod protein FlgG [Pseudovibrio exalbescens]MDX5593662.1 flagellar basal-body rod protein FlgG [Pseudovibrio sp. SPO723]